MKGIGGGLRWLASAKTSASAIAHTLASRVGILCINVVNGIVVARTLGPAGRGAASAVTLWPVVICGLLTLGVPVAIRFNIRQKVDDSEELFSVALILSGLLGIVAIGIGLVFIPNWLVHYPLWAIRFGQAMMFFSPLISVNTLLQGFLEARGDFVRSNSMVYIPTFGTLLCLVVLYFTHSITAVTVPLAYEVPFSLITIATLYRVRKFIRFPTQILRRSKLLLNFGSRAWGLDVLSTLSAQVGQVLVVGLLSAASFGLYSVALNVSRTLLVVGQSLNVVLFPKASELDQKSAIAMVSRSARLIFAINLVAGACLILAMPFLIRLAYGSAYLPDVRIARILTCEVILNATIITLAQSFMSTGRPGIVTMLQGVGLCTTFPLMLVFIPRFGLAGAAYALLCSTSLRFVLVLASYPMFLHHRVPGLLVTRQDVRDIRARLSRGAT